MFPHNVNDASSLVANSFINNSCGFPFDVKLWQKFTPFAWVCWEKLPNFCQFSGCKKIKFRLKDGKWPILAGH